MKIRMLALVGLLVIPLLVQATEQNDITWPTDTPETKATKNIKLLKKNAQIPEKTKPSAPTKNAAYPEP